MTKTRSRPPRWWLFILFILVASAGIWRFATSPKPKAMPPIGSKEFLTNAVKMVQEEEAEATEKYWKSELAAEEYGAIIEKFWDDLNSSSNKWEVVKALGVEHIVLGNYEKEENQPHHILVRNPFGSIRLNGDQWRSRLMKAEKEGWILEQSEFRHIGFEPARKGDQSTYYFSAHFSNPMSERRTILEGNIKISWHKPGEINITEINASSVQVRERQGTTPFKINLNKLLNPVEGSYWIDPLIVRDLDGDGKSEIILAAKNLFYTQTSNGEWKEQTLCEDNPRMIFTAMIEDFTGDGLPDFLCVKFDGIFLHEGSKEGKFPGNGRLVWEAKPRIKYGQALTCGDIDGDGDLDLFLGQYRVPYEHGQMPFPYFDALDGNPSFLLVNDGHGNFTDITERSGVGAKRTRRNYSASLIDFDMDGDLDLIMVSDFAGVDSFENDGSGKFVDSTGKWFSETRAFGMAHGFADWNADGKLDFLMVGMNSPTADRLASLGATRESDVNDRGMRESVTYGNRLYFGQNDGHWEQQKLSEKVARTGWSWGCAADDFDNDGFTDLYIVNGHATMNSVKDYETEFWLHDIYMRPTQENPLTQAYYKEKFLQTRGKGWSYGGYEKNRYFLNIGGTNFIEAAYLFGLALQEDCRNVVAEDVNGDGKLDLVVTTFESFPQTRQSLKIYLNQIPESGNWLEIENFQKGDIGHLFSVTAGNRTIHSLATGTSYRSQNAPRLHLGLGAATNVTVRREPGGKEQQFPADRLNGKVKWE